MIGLESYKNYTTQRFKGQRQQQNWQWQQQQRDITMNFDSNHTSNTCVNTSALSILLVRTPAANNDHHHHCHNLQRHHGHHYLQQVHSWYRSPSRSAPPSSRISRCSAPARKSPPCIFWSPVVEALPKHDVAIDIFASIPGNPHVVLNSRENSRFEKEALASNRGPATLKFCTVSLPTLHHFQHLE